MSARERLRAFIIQNSYAHDMPYRLLPEGEEWGTGARPDLDIPDEEYPAVVDGLLDAYRAEVLREAAYEILGQRWCADDGSGAMAAADFITP